MAKYALNENYSIANLKKMSLDQLTSLSNEIRYLILHACSEYGGHLSSNLGVVELTIALFKVFSFPDDKLIFDVGHQSYTQKLLSSRALDNLKRSNGVDGFQKRSESIFDVYEGGHSSTSISGAMGMAYARDLNHDKYKIIVVIGDASLANGLAFEALNNLKDLASQLLIIVNDNQMAITPSVGHLKDELNTLATNKLFSNLGVDYLTNIDGNNLETLIPTLEKIKNVNHPLILHLYTKKGKGYPLAENDVMGKYHSIPPFDLQTGEILTSPSKTYATLYGEALFNLMKQDNKIITINPANLYSSNLLKIQKMFPSRTFDVGIEESHCIEFACGFALSGFHPYIAIYSTFLQRGYDEISHDIARMDLGITFLLDHSGLVGFDGETHQGIYDLAFLASIPNTTIMMGKDEEECLSIFEFSKTFFHPLFIRFPKGEIKHHGQVKPIAYLQYEILKTDPSEQIVVITFGPKINEVLEIDLSFSLINAIFNYPYSNQLIEELKRYQDVIIYDPYGIENGFCSLLSKELLKFDYQGKIHFLALKNQFIKRGSILEQEELQGVDFASLKRLIEKIQGSKEEICK